MSIKKVTEKEDIKSITKEEEEQISSLQKEYSQTILKIGELNIQKNNINTILDSYYKQITELMDKEKKLIEQLNIKYKLDN